MSTSTPAPATTPATAEPTTVMDSPMLRLVVPILERELRDVLARLSNTRMYPTPEAVARAVEDAARWIARELDTARPFIPTPGVVERVEAVVAAMLPDFVAPYVGSFPKDTIAQVVGDGARTVAHRLTAEGLLIPALPTDPEALALRDAISRVQARTVLSDGVMGGGYYTAAVPSEDIAAALYAAGWRQVSD